MATATAPVKSSTILRKRLVVCCDGTWNDSVSSKSPLTNVSRISRCIKAFSDRDDVLQVVYYQTGIGTGTSKVGKVVDGAIGRGIGTNIRDAYSFICHNYHDEHDEIILIGFSRGAFTVRCVASFIDQVGLLRKRALNSLYEIYQVWKRQREPGDPKTNKPPPLRSLQELCKELKKADLIRSPPEIKACAVWDTVSALGFPMPIGVPQYKSQKLAFVDEKLCSIVTHAFHALALDERRRQFEPLLWRSPDERSELKQCWFLGAHSDIGGGAQDAALANITLIWMIAQLEPYLDFDFDTLWDLTTAVVFETREWYNQTRANSAPAMEPTAIERHAAPTLESSAHSEKYSRHSSAEVRPAIGKVQKSLRGVFRLGGAIKRIPGRLHTVQKLAFTIIPDTSISASPHQQDGSDDQDRADPEHNHTIHFTVRVMLGKKLNTSRALKHYYTALNSENDQTGVVWNLSSRIWMWNPAAVADAFIVPHVITTSTDTINEDKATEREQELLRIYMEHDMKSQESVSKDVDSSIPHLDTSEGPGGIFSSILHPLLSEATKPTIFVNINSSSEQNLPKATVERQT